MTDHGEYECPSPCCSGRSAEVQIVRDVYGCTAGRHCTQATPEQRIAFEAMITKRIAALASNPPEAT